MLDRLSKCYYWHIITLALMKNKRNEIKKELAKYRPKYKKLNS